MFKSIIALLGAVGIQKTLKNPYKVTEQDTVSEEMATMMMNTYLNFAVGFIWGTFGLYAMSNMSKHEPDLWKTSDFVFLSLMFAGIGIRLWAIKSLGKYFTFELAIRKDHKLITKGPYKYLRHPSYTGLLLEVIGYTLFMFNTPQFIQFIAEKMRMISFIPAMLLNSNYIMTACVYGALLAFSFLVHDRLVREETMLENEFKEEWIQFSKTRFRLVPYLY
jgi:protein-S-isoprenylcysteine O-methyltransferase Ste14